MRRIKVLEKIILSNTEESKESLKNMNIEHKKLRNYLISQMKNKDQDIVLK